jgi:hypothetical protein
MMSEFTIFSAPKPFTDPHINIIQRNAIQSWLRSGAEQVILIGQEEGLSQAADEFGVHHLTEVEKNQHGTPLISSIFNLARKNSQHDVLIYVNADILLLPDFGEKVQPVSQRLISFLGVGHRWDVDVVRELDFSPDWAQSMIAKIKEEGQKQRSFAIDYFVFPRDLYQAIPDFAVGRAGWDNWMIYHAREQGWPVVDLSPTVKVIHQNHDYSHLPGGQIHRDLDESTENVGLGGGIQNVYSILDADFVLQEGQLLHPQITLIRLLRKLELWVSSTEPGSKRWALSRKIRRLWVRLERRDL